MSHKIVKRTAVIEEVEEEETEEQPSEPISVFIAQDEKPVVDVADLAPYEIYRPTSYQDGPEGFVKWCEDMVCIPIYPVGSVMSVWCPLGNLPKDVHPKTGKSYISIWEAQKDICRQALRMVDGEFIHRLIILCWMRGEGKSLLACLIQLWKFFNWSKQQIVLGANSKEQITFVHFDIMKDIILNSPMLLDAIGKKNIQEKKIRLLDKKGNVASVIRAISSFSGIVSNITGYTFSEIFDMKNSRFFVQLDGSIRNIPNALGVIDSTVSTKQHILYQLYNSYITRSSKTVYFSYRFSLKGNADDYWNPNMDQGQLDDYRSKFPIGDFERYFLNTWGSASQKVFLDKEIEAWNYIGADGLVGNAGVLMNIVGEKKKYEEDILFYTQTNRYTDEVINKKQKVIVLQNRLMPLEDVYHLRDAFGHPISASLDDLTRLGNLLDTKWAILLGLDRADPMKITNKGARTMFTCVAKGLPGSASRPFLIDDGQVPNYVYFVLQVANVENHRLEPLKELILSCKSEYDGIDKMCGERWGIWDLVPWCEAEDISLEVVFPTYDKQRAAFSELYLLSSGGRFKCPPLGVWGSKETDILREEAKIFYHDADKHWFGSPEKNESNGIQDDCLFSIAWSIYGGREINVNDFKDRRSDTWYGTMITDRLYLGAY